MALPAGAGARPRTAAPTPAACRNAPCPVDDTLAQARRDGDLPAPFAGPTRA